MRLFSILSFLLLFQTALANDDKVVQLTTPLDIPMGSKNAPVTIVKYTSLTCDHCASFHLHVLPEVKEKYIKTSKLRFIIMPYPMDKYALDAFKLVYSLPEDQREMGLTKAFGSQDLWLKDGPERLGKMLGFNKQQVKEILNNEELENSLLMCAYKGQKELGILATPAFFMGGRKVEGAPTIEEFDASYNELIKQQEQKM